MPGFIRNFLRWYFLSKGSSIQNLKSIGVVEQQIIPPHFGRSRDLKTSHIWYQMEAN
jgi:hypothetical protein